MIKRFNNFINESLLDKIEGYSNEEVIEKLKDNPNELLRVSIKNEFDEGIIYAINNGANLRNLKYNDGYVDDILDDSFFEL